jgi:hypothetical protein
MQRMQTLNCRQSLDFTGFPKHVDSVDNFRFRLKMGKKYPQSILTEIRKKAVDNVDN